MQIGKILQFSTQVPTEVALLSDSSALSFETFSTVSSDSQADGLAVDAAGSDDSFLASLKSYLSSRMPSAALTRLWDTLQVRAWPWGSHHSMPSRAVASVSLREGLETPCTAPIGWLICWAVGKYCCSETP